MGESLPTRERLVAIQTLLTVKQFGPQKFKQLHEERLAPEDVLADPSLLTTSGKRGEKFRSDIAVLSKEERDLAATRADKQLAAAAKYHAHILTYDDPAYPPVLYASKYPVPVLFARGELRVLQNSLTFACVGSRATRDPYASLAEDFCRSAAEVDAAVVSGFALGADSIGHTSALENGADTIAVLAGGLDRPFPPENRDLWDRILASNQGCFVSETSFGIRTSSLLLRKRNKLIVALSQAVLVAQSSSKGGAMNAYRFALELGRRVATFAADGTDDTSGNLLISEDGAGEVTVFPKTGPRSADYVQWLKTAFSLT